MRLWRPGKYLDFYAENPLGESANHSGVDVTGASYEPGTDTKDLFPEFFNHEGTGAEIPPDETYVLTPGDCLFIPEGWWHWVDSTPGTMAVNFWWESPFAMDLAAKVEPLLTFDLPPATLNERCDALMGALKGELESGLTQYRRRKIFAACGRVEKHRCVVSMTHCHGARMFRRQSSLSNTKWGRGGEFKENFPFYELFADRLCYDVKKVSGVFLFSLCLAIWCVNFVFFRFRLVTGTTRGTLNDGGRTRTWTVSRTTRGLRRTTTTCLRSASISCGGSRTPPRKSSGTF